MESGRKRWGSRGEVGKADPELGEASDCEPHHQGGSRMCTGLKPVTGAPLD